MTYYAKGAGSLDQRLLAAMRQLRNDALSTGMLPHLLVLAVLTPFLGFGVLRRISERGTPGPYAILAFFGCSWLAYWLYIGGDVFAERFLLIIAAISWTAIGLVMQVVSRRGRALPFLAALLLAVLPLGLQLNPLLHDGRFDYRAKDYDMWEELGTFLGKEY